MDKASNYLQPKKSSTRKVIDGSIEEGIKDHNEEFPKTRAECPVVRPCPFVSCRYNLYLEAKSPEKIRINFYGLEPHHVSPSCALDEADSGEFMSLEDIGSRMGLTRERVREIERQAIEKLKAAGLNLK